MNVDRPAACFSCHVLGISSASALGAYMFYRAKKANTSTHRFTCAFLGLEDRSELNVSSTSKSNLNELYYKIDIGKFDQINYKCERCLKEYTEFDIGKLYKNNTEENLICTGCDGIVNENNNREEKVIRCDMRLFNEQMASLFQVLEKIDQLMRNEHSTTVNCGIKSTIEKDKDSYFSNMDTDETNVKLMKSKEEIKVKPLPEWFVRSTVHTEPDQTNID